MAIFSASRQALKPHAHAADEVCPWCDQPISHDKFEDIRRRMTAEQDERIAALAEQHVLEKAAAERKAKAALEQARAEAAAAAEQRVAAARSEAMRAAEAAVLAKVGEVQSRLVAAEQEKAAAQAQIAALKQDQEAALAQRLQDARGALQKERDTAVLAEKAKVLKLQSDLLDMQRKLEGKTANELGEGSEIDLFEELRGAFEGDRIRRVGKGINGADVIHEVVHNGRVCGKIIYDSKNRDSWQNGFATKLHADKLAEKADHAVLSSNKFPKGAQQLHLQDGVIVASPARILALAELLRRQILQTHQLRISGDAREHKSEALYAFITSERCKQLLDSIDAQAGKMLELDTTEEKAHRLTWERRNKLIQSVKKVQGDLTFEIDRIIGTAGNGPEDEAAA